MTTESAEIRLMIPVRAGVIIDHVKAVRIPLLNILFGLVMTFWVDQVWELFLLLTLPTCQTPERVGALVMTACLGLAVWHTSRTVYRFNIPTIPTLADPRAVGLRLWLPRMLGALIPVLMAAGTASALRDPAVKTSAALWSSLAPVLFALEGVALFMFFVWRRPLVRAAFKHASTLALAPSDDPRVNRWSQLPRSVRIVYAIVMIANIFAILVAALWPGALSSIGAFGILLLCGTFLTITGTYLTIQAARWQFPLLTALFLITILLQLFGLNDNHRVRLYPDMHSYTAPKIALVDASAPIAQSFVDFTKSWQGGLSSGGPVYLVSSEGGGIRAAVWTVLVLSRLEVASNGEFSKHMLLGSGVSGGSVGLTWFAAIVRGERLGVIKLSDIDTMVQRLSTADYLGPTLETMFLTDFLQRFVPVPIFVDRGERLETRFEKGWNAACLQRLSASSPAQLSGTAPRMSVATSLQVTSQVCSLLSAPWKNLWAADADRVPALFLNSTEVQSGERFIQEPFAAIRGKGLDFDITNAGTWSANLLPASAPLSGVAHNSARFTYMSPAGSLMDAATLRPKKSPTRQLVDGGYFENSGTTTIAELLDQLLAVYGPQCTGTNGFGGASCPLKLIHISNDPGLEQMRSDDSCADAARYASPYSHYGEIRAPLLSLLNTREARGAAARSAVRRMFAGGKIPSGPTDKVTDDSVFHFRLCNGPYHLPLGWTLSADSLNELSRQLEGTSTAVPAGFNHRQLNSIVGSVQPTPAAH
jgi:hypothetical protein